MTHYSIEKITSQYEIVLEAEDEYLREIMMDAIFQTILDQIDVNSVAYTGEKYSIKDKIAESLRKHISDDTYGRFFEIINRDIERSWNKRFVDSNYTEHIN